jgi:hypothetical protein
MFTALNTIVQQNIRQNGQQEISGNLLQGVLLEMIISLGKGEIIGLAEPATIPITDDRPRSYFASTAGTYQGFGSAQVNQGEIVIFKNDGAAWNKIVIYDKTKTYITGANIDNGTITIDKLDSALQALIGAGSGGTVSINHENIVLDLQSHSVNHKIGLVHQPITNSEIITYGSGGYVLFKGVDYVVEFEQVLQVWVVKLLFSRDRPVKIQIKYQYAA